LISLFDDITNQLKQFETALETEDTKNSKSFTKAEKAGLNEFFQRLAEAANKSNYKSFFRHNLNRNELPNWVWSLLELSEPLKKQLLKTNVTNQWFNSNFNALADTGSLKNWTPVKDRPKAYPTSNRT
ncbi:MAG: hypothetical protein ACKPKO_28830, partial [Candidatus Fonsibacter sp.]